MGIVIMHSDGREGGEGRRVKIEDRIEEEREKEKKRAKTNEPISRSRRETRQTHLVI